MGFATYTELQAAIADKLNRNDLTTRIPGFITLAEAEISRRIKGRERYERWSTVLEDEFLLLPEGFAGVRAFSLEGGAPLTFISEASLLAKKLACAGAGEPRYYAIVGPELQVYPAPDAEYGCEMTYRAKLAPLSADNASNWVLAAHPDAYFYGALVHAGGFLKDPDEMATAKALSEAALDQIALEEIEQQYGDKPALRRKPF